MSEFHWLAYVCIGIFAFLIGYFYGQSYKRELLEDYSIVLERNLLRSLKNRETSNEDDFWSEPELEYKDQEYWWNNFKKPEED